MSDLKLDDYHAMILTHLSKFHLPEDALMPYQTTALGMLGELPEIAQARLYRSINYLEAADLIRHRKANLINRPRGLFYRGPSNCFTITPTGRDELASYLRPKPRPSVAISMTVENRAASKRQRQSTLEEVPA